tara:strand:- start:3505 stop:3696 length:192 start_codon:yes stop_codon:yes gene_type:complete
MALHTLKASHNKMVLFPVQIFSIPSLVEIDLSYNKITAIPQSLPSMKSVSISLNIAQSAKLPS